ncbi:1,3-beta-glucanase [Brachybacterium sp. JHP9]|uniref:glucan endo-1,3-beta-D-glucosidase n=1 Tax=Brachybacterium equifaecis TaxID=2910770 RepID=A0ABT0R2J8_9MICO|nr:glycosyl hydrolase [Brachybacterium equifaecis]MCL6423130.1 1,3-beta-glucanase [Brachybacterium equifaecis]
MGEGPAPTGPTGSSSGDVFSVEQVQSLTAGVPEYTTPTDLKPARLGEGLVPPTNRWFSGLVFGDEAQPVFPLPLSFGLQGGGFAFGMPAVAVTEKTIASGFNPAVSVTVANAGSSVVSAYDDASVTVQAQDASGGAIGDTVIAEGSPIVSFTAVKDAELTLDQQFVQTGDHYEVDLGGDVYGLVLGEGATLDGSVVNVPEGATVSWFAVPKDGDAAALAGLAADPLTSTSATYEVGADSVTTTVGYITAGGGETAFVAMPHQQKSLVGLTCDLGTYPSVFGELSLCSGTELSWGAPKQTVNAQLDLSGLSQSERELLAQQVAEDVGATPEYPADTYFGGKALYRDAMLYSIASQVGADEAAATARERLLTQMRQWTQADGCSERDAFCFAYDAKNKGVIGLTPSFGSEEYNDHHFHYGYFLYAAGVVAKDDPALVEEFAPVMDLLAADIANDATTGELPVRRTFDVYQSHSWASGTSPFADGNNQESSSEAVNAYAGLQLWAEASGNDPLAAQAQWMMANEASSALSYWTNFDRSEDVYQGYGHTVIPLNFGAKRDYATWFSPEPAAMLAILALPLSPSSDFLGVDPARVDTNIGEATAAGGYNQTYGDWLLMYSALGGEEQKAAALQQAQTLSDEWIDDGNTRSYMYAYIMSR